MEKPLYDRNHRVVGYIDTKPNGDQILCDHLHRIKGYYTKKSDMTTDNLHRISGYGNLLTSLLNNDDKKHR